MKGAVLCLAAALLTLPESVPASEASRPAAVPPSASRPARLVVLSWDGAADAVVDRLLAEGRLPNVARLRSEGASAEYSVTSFPSKTAAGHAALWTGCWSSCNGVTDNSVLYGDLGHSLLEHRRGFSSEALLAEPLFVTAAKAGRKVVVLSATQADPETPHVEALRRAGADLERYVSFNCFDSPIAAGRTWTADDLQKVTEGWGEELGRAAREATIPVGEETFYVLLFDDPADPRSGLDTVLIRQGSRRPGEAVAEARLKPHAPWVGETTLGSGDVLAAWSPPFRVERGELFGYTFFRLFALDGDAGSLVLYQRAAFGCATSHPELLEAYFDAYPGFYDEAAFFRYSRGQLGEPLMAGGDGTAERRLLELVAFDVELLIRGTRFVLTEWQPDVLFHYSPMADSAGHTWFGALDPASQAYDPKLAQRLWPYFAQVYGLLDEWLGAILRSVPPETVVALASDHGMAGVGKRFYVNRVLEEAGLLHRGEDGGVDLSRTRILVPPSTDFFLKVNRRGRLGGVVAAADVESVLAAASEALLAARDPATGKTVVTRLFRVDELGVLGVGGPLAGDLYLDVAPGYYPSRKLSESVVEPSSQPWGEGGHGFWPERRDMHAIFYLSGPGVRRGVTVAPIRHVDVAPTLARLLGIPAPPQATGRVVEEMLVEPSGAPGF